MGDKGSDKLSEVIESKFRDNDIETEVAAFLVRKNTSMAALVEVEWFGSQLIGDIIALVKDLKAIVSRSSIVRELKKRGASTTDEATYAAVLDDVFSVDTDRLSEKGVKVAIEDLLTMYESRRIMYSLRDVVSTVRTGTFSLDDVKATLRDLGSPVAVKDNTKAGEYLEGYESRVEVIAERRKLREDGGEVGVLTGIGAFDRLTGGIMRKEFGVIGGRPSIGKTAALASFAVNAWFHDRSVLFVSGEMGKIDIEFRIDSMVAGIPASGFRSGELSDESLKVWERAVRKERGRRENFLEIVSFPKGFDMSDVEAEALRVQDKHKRQLDLVVLDYINILYPINVVRGRASKDWSAQSDAIWEFKDFVADFNDGIAGWTAGQLRDEALESDVLSLGDLKYSRGISETSPVVVGLVRTDKAEVEHTLEMQVLKMRNAKLPDKSIILRPNLEYMRIHEEVLGVKDLRLLGEDMTPRRDRKTKQRRATA